MFEAMALSPVFSFEHSAKLPGKLTEGLTDFVPKGGKFH
jgi:hypothetical protein